MDSIGDTNAHYFDADPSITSNPATIELVLPDVYLTLATDSGVFSGSKVDSGTRYLLREHPPIPGTTRTILDLGCGYGPIALTCAKRAPDAVVWGVDVNNRALSLAKVNAEHNNITNATFGQPDDIPVDVRFDLIVTNPPIRIGKTALHDLLDTWLSRLNEDGRAWLVVQKHLGSDSLSTWLNHQGWSTERLGSRKGYRILEARARAEARQ